MYEGLRQTSRDRGEIRSYCKAPAQHHLAAGYVIFHIRFPMVL